MYGAGMGGGIYGGGMGGGMYGGGMYGGGMYGGGMYGGGMYGGGLPLITPYTVPAAQPATPQAGPLGVGAPGATTTAGGADQTGTYLTASSAAAAAISAKIPRVIANPFDNTLLIQATPQDYQQILKLLDQLDVAPRQILIEAKIYEVNLQGVFSSGVQAYLQRTESALPKGFPAPFKTPTLQAASNAGLSLTAGMLVGHSRELLAILTATENNKQAKLVSAPMLIATDSIPASMNVGDSVPTLSAQAVGNLQESGNSLFTQSVNNVQTGVTLNFVARATPGGVITLKIQQEVSAPVAPDPDAKIPSPSFQKRSLSTQVTVQDGDTIGIGGIIQETNTYSTSGVPLLHRIPGIGAAFGGKNLSKTRTELVVLITPRVIYDTNQVVDATDELKSNFKKLRSVMKD
jgi:general secretion pathway protein D